MFANPIHDLIPDIFYADPALQDYACEDFKGDTVPTIVSMVLLAPRNIPPRSETARGGKYIRYVPFNVGVYNYNDTRPDFEESVLNLPAFRVTARYDEIRIVSLNNGTKSDADCMFDILERKMPQLFDVKRLGNVEQYLYSQRRLRSVVFHCESTNSTMVVVERVNHSKLHLILSAYPILLPALFKDYPVTDWERKFLNSLTDRDDTRFVSIVKDWLADNSWKNKILAKQLKNFVSNRVENQKRSIIREIDTIDRDIEQTECNLTDLYRRRENKTTMLLGIETRVGEDNDEELIDYFKSNKDINLVSATDSRLVFEVKTSLTNYDPEAFDAYTRSHHSELYKDWNYYEFSGDEGRALMKAIFDTNKMQVMMRGKFILDFDHQFFDINRSYSPFLDNTVANPHLTDYNCPGNNGKLIRDAIRSYDYVMAIAYCISVTGNLNFGEPHNVSNFMRHLFGEARNKKCIVNTETGEMVTVREAIEYLKKGE